MPTTAPPNHLIVIAGATGTGKTTLAITLAQQLATAVISADSRQVYREFDIGTAKPSLQERHGILHHLLDVADPTSTYTVAQYQAAACEQIEHLHQLGKIPILVGGTGLYIQAVTEGLAIPPVPPNPALRELAQSLSDRDLWQQLQTASTPTAARIHPHDRVRTLRALEIISALGYLPERTKQVPSYTVLWVGLDHLDLVTYSAQLEQRTEQMLAQGWLAEITQLQTRYGANLPLLQTLGYAQMAVYLAGSCDLTSAIAQTVLKTRQYAKRQRTWFRRYQQMQWFDPSQQSILEITEKILSNYAD